MSNIADYDKQKYDYANYWKDKNVDRSYEDRAERIVLKKLLPRAKSRGWFVDLGGGYGRLYDTYKDRFENKIIVDYSLDSLKKAQQTLTASYQLPATYFIAANAYHLPFKDGSIDTLMTVRMLHHIDNIPVLFQELARVIRRNLILEYANKRHGLSVIKKLLGRNKLNPFSHAPEKHGDLFYNFHPRYIADHMKASGFKIGKVRSVSNFRHKIFKKLLPAPLLYMKESVAQWLLAPITFGPSIFLLAQKKREVNYKSEIINLKSILVCPKCNSDDLAESSRKVICAKCSTSYAIIDGIYDFRV